MDFLPPGSNLAILDDPRREGIMREKQNGTPSLISFVRGWPPHKLGAGIPRDWRDQMQFLIPKMAGDCGVRKEM